jgi:hypothetical protein
MREMLCETWRLFYILFRRILGITLLTIPNGKLTPEGSREDITKCSELLSLVHEELGVHKWCGHGNGTTPFDSTDLRKTIGLDDGSIFEVQYRRMGSRDLTVHVLPLWYIRFGKYCFYVTDVVE